MEYVVLLLGLCIGSFLNVVIYRLPKDESIVGPRSYCPQCSTTLKWYNLIPVLSFVIQKGKCPYCGIKISARYIAVELLTAGVFLAVYLRYGITWQSLNYWVFSALLIAASFIDLEHKIIPNEIIVAGIILGSVLTIKTVGLSGLYGIFLGGGLLLGVAVASRGNMGGGDIKLAAVMGLFLGWKLLLVALFTGFLTGSFVGLTLLVTGVMGRKDPFPFGPFLALGSLISLLWGNKIIFWYLNRFI